MADDYDNFIKTVLDNDFLLRSSGSSYEETGGIVRGVDMMAKKNGRAHRTGRYAFVKTNLNLPVYRRGQPFSMKIGFNTEFQLTQNNLRLDFSYGGNPLPGNGTLAQLPVTGSKVMPQGTGWGVCVTNVSGLSIDLEVKSSPACPVGIWWLTVVTQPGNQVFKASQHMYILFNPWCQDDSVYMENEAWLNEYVLNDVGFVYQGDHIPTNWGFKQFEPATLTTAMYVLQSHAIKDVNRGNPIDVTRALSLMGNYAILAGNWSGKYYPHTEPLAWTGSYGIVERYMETKEIVKYGQCWCFSGLTTALCRSIGIPCRSVTNYDSAHDTNKDIVIDVVWDLSKENAPEGNSDSIWNFHVWNDAWMARPDLPDGFGGWQAIDATAQEMSPHRKYNPNYLYECGPASVEAIKKGEIGLQYDAMFVFAEVNGDQRLFQKMYDGSYVLKDVYQSSVGTALLTKAVGANSEVEVTLDYKFREGSKEERAAVYRAATVAGTQDKLIKPTPSVIAADVFFNLMKTDGRMIGQSLRISVQVENNSGENRMVDVSLGAHSVEYTGTATHNLDVSINKAEAPIFRKKLDLGPEDKEIVTTLLLPQNYVDKLSYMGHVRFFATGVVAGTNQTWFKSHTVLIRKPPLIIEMPNELTVGKPVTITLQFTNPLQNELTNCSFTVEGSCTPKPISIPFRNVRGNENVSHPITFTAENDGHCTFMAIFNSNLLNNVKGSKEVLVN